MLFLSTPGTSPDFTPDNLNTKFRTSLFLHSPPLTVLHPATCGDLRRCVAEAVSRYTQRMPKASCCRRPQAPFHAFPISSPVVLFLLTSQSNACLPLAVCHSELLRNRVWRAGGGCGVTAAGSERSPRLLHDGCTRREDTDLVRGTQFPLQTRRPLLVACAMATLTF